jgi:hypothetical protein
MVSDIGWISITTIYPKIYDRLLTPFITQILGQNLKVTYIFGRNIDMCNI